MIIWIASYPKSGNTWIRALLSSYLFSDDGNFNFELLKNIEQFSSKNISLKLNKDVGYQMRISKSWIPSQELINRDKKIRFFKTHNAICSINGNKFTDEFNTLAAIYLVRDPRNIITSLANHYELSLEETLSFLTNKKKIIFPINFIETKKTGEKLKDFNFIGDWSGHYLSWKKIGFCPVKIIKYEDILSDTREVFISVLEFLSKFIKLKINIEKIDKSIHSTSFNILSKMEAKEGFFESTISHQTKKKVKFFNLGRKNDWRKLLDNKTVQKINRAFKNEMDELNYL